MNFFEILPELRRSQGLSQEELAAKIGVSRQAVSKWETGEAMPDLNKLLALSNALGVSLDRLCGREEVDSSERAAVDQKRKRSLWPILCAILALFIILLLLQLGNLLKEDRQGSALVEVTVLETTAFYSANGHTVRYRIVPSVICEDYRYQLQLTPETPVFGVPNPIVLDPASGVFQGEISFPLTASRWAVSLRVEADGKTYIVPVATNLYYKGEGLVSWEAAA